MISHVRTPKSMADSKIKIFLKICHWTVEGEYQKDIISHLVGSNVEPSNKRSKHCHLIQNFLKMTLVSVRQMSFIFVIADHCEMTWVSIEVEWVLPLFGCPFYMAPFFSAAGCIHAVTAMQPTHFLTHVPD